MVRLVSLSMAWGICLGICGAAWGQDNRARELAPGVLKVVPLAVDTADSQTLRMPLPDLNAKEYTPNTFPSSQTLLGSTRDVVLFRDIWQYEFAFLGLRQIELDVPMADGSVEKKNVWYLVYRVRNVGKTVSYDSIKDQLVGTEQHRIVYDRTEVDPSTLPGRFFPVFTLVGWVANPQTGDYQRVEYTDRVLPTAARQIQLEEDDRRELLDSVEMARIELALSEGSDHGSVWGVATWTDVDPRIDYVSVRIKGLTNAYRIINNVDGSKSFRFRELQLNFYRPGDIRNEPADRISLGIPLVDSAREQATITQRYELPGPLFQIYETINEHDRELKFEADSQLNLESFISPLAITLDDAKMPESLAKGFAEIGVTVPENVPIEQLVPGAKWGLKVDERQFDIELNPQFWERLGDGIRLIKDLDHLWLYR
jgi:hypothetical protein